MVALPLVLDRKRARPMREARRLHAAGRFEEARHTLAPVLEAQTPSVGALRGMAELHYLLADYASAERLLLEVVERARSRRARLEAEAALALTYYQTDAYHKAKSLFTSGGVDLPIWKLMAAFDGVPYQLDWTDRNRIELPMLQSTDYDLPEVLAVTDGIELAATIDTGGDLFTIPADTAADLGIDPVVSFGGSFAGGATAPQAHAVLNELRLGGLTIRNVPITIGAQETAVIGTGLLRHVLPTMDYPHDGVVLRRRGADSRVADGTEIPFAMALTHFIVATGSLDGANGLTFMVDSGLVDPDGASFIAPATTLERAGIPVPETESVTGTSGAGEMTLDVGRFPIRRLCLGPLALDSSSGLFGVFPPELANVADFTIHGSISHHFLRDYVWTIDFDRRVLVFGNAS